MSDEQREALAEEVRRLIHSVRAFDGPDDAAVHGRQLVQAAIDHLEPHRLDGPFMQAGLGERVEPEQFDTGDPMAIFPYSPVVGRLNPLAPPVEMWVTDSGEVRGRGVLEPAYTGPPRSVHGGVIALVFDELLGSTTVVNKLGAPTGTLTVIYRAFTPQGQTLDLRSWVDRTEGRKVFIKGEIRHRDKLCAEAEGIFILVRPRPGDDLPFGGR